VVAGANAHVTSDLLDEHEELIRKGAIVLTQLEIPLQTVVHLSEMNGSIQRSLAAGSCAGECFAPVSSSTC
jgi:hypothetical protein